MITSQAERALLGQAQRLASQGQIAEAERIFLRLLESAPEHPAALGFVAMCKLARRETDSAIGLLERARAAAPDDAELLKNLGLAYRAGGRSSEAADALQRAVMLDPEYFLARLHLAIELDALGEQARALPEFFRAINAAQQRNLWTDEQNTPPGLRDTVLRAMRRIDSGRQELFSRSLAPLQQQYGADALRRVSQALRIYLRIEAAQYPDPRQRPLFLFVPGLRSHPYFDRSEFAWVAALEAAFPAIRGELLGVMRDSAGFEPFLQAADGNLDGQLHGSRGAPNWNALFFHRHGKRYDDNCRRCPLTSDALDGLPMVSIRDHAPEVLFSVLTPGTHILPHRGVTNTRLVCHLPLIVPEDCALRVGGEVHEWQEGRCVVFDDSYEHEAWNRSEQTRVVLILDTWHPDLSDVERAAITELVGAIGDFNQSAGVH